jgi:3-oxoacyl-(acyl-carrier-protein) synthase
MSDPRRIVITGMAVNTPLGDSLNDFLEGLLAGRSAITRWRAFETERLLAKIGGDLSSYDSVAKLRMLSGSMPEEAHERLRRISKKAPWTTRLSLLLCLEAWRDAGLWHASPDAARTIIIAAGHGFASRYAFECQRQFEDEPDFMDPLYAIQVSDPDIVARASEVLGTRGLISTVGGACGSGALALRSAMQELRYGGAECALVVAPVMDISPVGLQGLALLGAISVTNFNDEPTRASRPWDTRREGFVPSHGGAAMILEPLDSAQARGARIHAELLSAAATSAANHLPESSEEAQAAAMCAALEQAGVRAEEIDFINAHATSTPRGDVAEIRSIKRVLGSHAARVKVNASKSMLGHTLCAAPLVENVGAILQMKGGRLHGSLNIDQLDPEVDLDVCTNGPVLHETQYCLKNAFGFGGINCACVLRRLGR